MINPDQSIKLKDGRTVQYAEYGDPIGTPVFVFHGNPNSRLLWGCIPGVPFIDGIRLIAPDRPGYGGTDNVNGISTAEQWPYDMLELADSLNIAKFFVFGPSGGGPFALSCAQRIPDRLFGVGVFAPVGPLDKDTSEGVAPAIRTLWKVAGIAPWLLKPQFKMTSRLVRKNPALYVKLIKKELSESDRETYDHLDLFTTLKEDRLESYRQDGIGSWYDTTLPKNYPVDFSKIGMPVSLWQGEKDGSVPLSMGKAIAAQIPRCMPTFIPNAGHFWLFENIGLLLKQLLESGDE
jgi:pimeloyl-ACP methyl ester carboxylesterase